MIIKLELYNTEVKLILDCNLSYYNLDITVHGLVMIFLFLMPSLFGGLGNMLLPIYSGMPDMILPRMNNLSILILVIVLGLFILALVSEYNIGAG